MVKQLLRRRQSTLVTLCKGLLPVGIVLDDERAGGIGTEAPAALDRQFGSELEATGALHSFDGDLEVGDGLVVVDGGVGEDKGAQCDIATGPAILGKDDLVKVRRHGDGGRVANHLVLDVPLVVDGVLAGEVEGAGDDADRGVADGEAAAKVLKVRPVVAVEALADLGTHVGEVKGLVHGRLGPLGVGGGHLVAAVVAAAVVVLEAGAELGRHGGVLDKCAVLAVGVAARQRGRRDVLDDPVRVARPPVVRRDEGAARGHVGDGAGEAVLEEARGVDGRRARGGGGGGG